jgi:hypothetical protein
MENKKELTVGDFINLSMIYNVVDFQITVLSDGLIGDFAEDIKQDLQDIYMLVVSAVTLKDGTIPKYWDKPISDCHIAMSYQTPLEIYEKVDDFKNKHKYYTCDVANAIIENMNEPMFDIAVECLLSGLTEL